MKRTASKRVRTDKNDYYSMSLINQAYGSDKVRPKTEDFDINLLEGFYGTKSEIVAFYGREIDKLRRYTGADEERLNQ